MEQELAFIGQGLSGQVVHHLGVDLLEQKTVEQGTLGRTVVLPRMRDLMRMRVLSFLLASGILVCDYLAADLPALRRMYSST